jgi:DNA-directed RNA polymerase subunit RPC12/RpoP
MPIRKPRCPKCGKSPRYARPSLKRPAKDAEGNPIIENKEVVMEMAYVCRGCGEIFYHSLINVPGIIPDSLKEIVKAAKEHIEKKKAEAEKENDDSKDQPVPPV